MYSKRNLETALIICLATFLMPFLAQGSICPLQIFNNPGYNNDPNFNMYINVVSIDVDHVAFEVYNESLLSSTITEVLFDDGELLAAIADLTEGSGTKFKHPAREEVLPGGNLLSPPFVTTAGLSADRETKGGVSNGIDPGEHIIIQFELQDGKTIALVEQAIESGDLRVGVHVQRLPWREGYSDSASAVTPEPTVIVLLSFGSLSFVIRRRRKGI